MCRVVLLKFLILQATSHQANTASSCLLTVISAPFAHHQTYTQKLLTVDYAHHALS